MATADDYAGWIVKNADKKGTPEFDTVAAAYKEALAEEQPKAEAKPAPKKAEPDVATTSPMGEDLGSAIMSEAGEGLGVMSGKVPAAPVKTPSKVPFKPEVRAAIEAQYDAATPQDRKKMESAPGAVGDVIRQRAQEYTKEPEVAKNFLRKVEARTQRLIEAGENPEFARVAAEKAAAAGVTPGKEIQFMQSEGTLEKTDFDFEMQKQYKDANTLVRGAMAGYQGYKQGALGVNQAVADLVGADEFARTQGLGAKEARVAVESMGQNPNYVGRMFEGAISSIAQQLPAMTAGVISGSEAVVLGSMIAQSFGQEYAEGRAKGLDGLDAATRAGLMASFEGLGEKFGLKFSMDNIRRLTSRMKTDELAAYLGNALKKELPGEYLTTTGQFLTDLSSVGLNKDATFGDYLKQMADTTVQTLMQSGLMAGGTKAIEKGVAALGGGKETGAEQLNRLVGTTEETQAPSPVRRPTLGRLETARKPELEGEPLAPPLTKMEGTRNEAIEVAASPVAPPAALPADPRMDALVQSYVGQGYMQDDAQRLAQMELGALAPQQSFQDTTQQAVRSVLQAEAPNVPSTEPPPNITQPSTGEQSIGLPSEPTGEPTGGTRSAFDRGLDTARNLIGSVDAREERERASLEANKQRIAARLAKAFNSQALPNLAPIFGLSWQQQTMASNPTPEQFQEAAYNHLETITQTPVGYNPPPAPVEAKVEAAKPVETKPASTEDEVQARKDAEYQDVINEGYDQLDAFEASKKEKPSVTETIETKQAEKEGQKEPAAEPAASKFAPLELEAGRNEALELSGNELDAYNAMAQSRAELARIEQTQEKAVKTRAPGGGRKPSENKRTEEERNEQSKAINQFYRDVKTLLGFAEEASQRQAPETFKSAEEWQEKEDKRAQSLKTLQKVIYRESLKYGTTKGHISLKDYVRSMPEAQLAEAKAAVLAETGKAKKSRVSIPTQEHSTKVDPEFKQFSSLLGALSYVGMSGNFADKGVARALLDEKNRRFLKDVAFMVVEKDDSSIPDDVKDFLADSKGGYAPFEDKEGGVIYIAGESFGYTGMDNATVLHEALHAVTTLKLMYVEDAIEAGETSKLDPSLADAYKELQDLMKSAYQTLVTYRGPLQSQLDELVGFGVFEDTHEFLAYGLNDPAMKEFLRTTVPGTSTRTSGFDKLVEIIMQVLGVDPSLKSGLKDLILISNQIMETKVSAEAMREMSDKADAEIDNVIKAIRLTEKEVQAEYEKLQHAKDSKQKLSILGNMAKLSRDPTELGRLLVAKWNRMSLKDMRKTGFLKLLPTDELIKRGTELGIGSLNDITNTIDKMVTFRVKLLKQVDRIGEKWLKLKEQDAENLADVMHFTTLVSIDPTKDTSNKLVNNEWKKLTREAKAVYVAVRDWYANNYKLYGQYLQERVDAIAGDADESKTLMAAIRTTLEAGAKLAPYFPLMRYGKYWARIGGSGKKAVFAMFEDEDSRNAFVREHTAELAAKGDKRSRERMFEDGYLDEGNSLAELVNKLPEHNDTIRDLFATIDNMKSVDADAKNTLKQEVFQMHLNTMPDESFRKQFLHRKGTAGFTNDALRNFGNLSHKMINQLGRIKYGPALRNHVSAARASLQGNPDKAKLGMIVDRIEARVDAEIAPTLEDDWLAPAMQAATKIAFLWQMTGVKSAVTQLFSLTTHGLPVLWKHHGVGRGTMQALMDTASMGFGLVGKIKTADDGNLKYEFPSLRNSLAGNPLLQKAYDEFIDSQQNQQTRTADLVGRSKVPSSQYGALAKTIENGMTFFFHKAESMSREIMFIASFKLNYAKLSKDKNLTDEQKFDRAVQNAKGETKEALFNYEQFNTPEAMRPVPLQAVLQYRKYQLFSLTYLLRNGTEMLSNLPASQRAGAAKAFFGTLGLSGLLAGVRYAFMYGMIMAAIQGAINLLHDDDEEMPLELLNFKKYFENVWLPQKLGGLGNFAAHGLLDTVTGYDMGSGVSQDFWFRDGPEALNWKSAYLNIAAGLAGPAGGMVSNWVSAIDDFNNGDNLKAFEKLTPAMFRGIVTDIRYEKEGVRGMGLDPVKDSTKFTQFQYFMQALGYKTAPLAQKLSDNFAIKEIVHKVENQRSSLLRSLLRADELGTQREFNKVLDRIDRFNAMYPDREIEDENIEAAFDRREKMLEDTERGLYVPEGYEDLYKLGRQSDKALRKEERK